MINIKHMLCFDVQPLLFFKLFAISCSESSPVAMAVKTFLSIALHIAA